MKALTDVALAKLPPRRFNSRSQVKIVLGRRTALSKSVSMMKSSCRQVAPSSDEPQLPFPLFWWWLSNRFQSVPAPVLKNVRVASVGSSLTLKEIVRKMSVSAASPTLKDAPVVSVIWTS